MDERPAHVAYELGSADRRDGIDLDEVRAQLRRFTISVGVIVPGMLIASRACAAWIISGTRTADTRKRAPASSASSACLPEEDRPGTDDRSARGERVVRREPRR